jgi:hypothetical protein
MPKVNTVIDQTLESLHNKPAPVWALQQAYDAVYGELYSFQEANKQHNWLLLAVVLTGVIQLAISYSLYIHFLRMGYSWTKLCLHLNNLSLFTIYWDIRGCLAYNLHSDNSCGQAYLGGSILVGGDP